MGCSDSVTQKTDNFDMLFDIFSLVKENVLDPAPVRQNRFFDLRRNRSSVFQDSTWFFSQLLTLEKYNISSENKVSLIVLKF